MGITITNETNVDSSWANSKQPKVFIKDSVLSEMVS